MIQLQTVRPWAPRPQIQPETRREKGGALRIVSNGSEGCYGGWELVYPAPRTTKTAVLFRVKARWRDLRRGYDSVNTAVAWLDAKGNQVDWDPVFPARFDGAHVIFERLLRVPEGAHQLVIRLLMAWSETGSLWFSSPRLTRVPLPAPRRLRLGAAGCPLPPGQHTMESNIQFHHQLCRQAAQQKIDLVCLPEVILSWGIPRQPGDDIYRHAVTVPGPEVQRFCDLAKELQMAMCFSVLERNKELVHNTAVLIDKKGRIVGKYRKVHLAQPGEVWMGVTPGHDFPIFHIERAAIAMNVCMDSSAAESARVPARCGAEILLIPIMGDLRADGWQKGPPHFNVEKWMLIQRMRALDNQLYVVASRNSGYGSGVFSPRGEILAMGGEGRSIVWADVNLEDFPQTWTGSSFKAITWYERREPAYGPLSGALWPDPFAKTVRPPRSRPLPHCGTCLTLP